MGIGFRVNVVNKESQDGIFYSNKGTMESNCDKHVILDKFKKGKPVYYKYRCNIHNLEKDSQKNDLIRTGCKFCNDEGRRIINEKKFYDDFNNISDSKEFTILSKYINARTHVLMRHNVCGNEFTRTPDVILRPTTKLCLACNNSMYNANTLFTYKDKYEDYYKKEGFEIIAIKDKPISTVTKFNIRHGECGKILKMTHSNFYGYNVRCKYCNGHLSRLHGIVHAILDVNNLNIETEVRFDDCRNIYPLPFDFKVNISEYEFILIEVDGDQHYDKNNTYYTEELIVNDNIKTKYCQDNGIQLIRLRTSKLKCINSAYKELSNTFNITQKPDYAMVEVFKKDKISEDIVRAIRQGYVDGEPSKTLSKRYNISNTQTHNILKYHIYDDTLLELRDRIIKIRKFNSNKPPVKKPKLLPYKDDILKMRKEGFTYKKIAEKYKVSPPTIRYMVQVVANRKD